ncbi:MAG: thermonuclease family protein [Candidatus Bipolaricaulota bacterium]|nr:thermonuclease family protein [Candidatus Bipolaricaulota bacterium]
MRGVICALLLGALAGVGWAQPPEGALPARITRWLDGDTCMIRFTGPLPPGLSPNETVRLLGVNAPETGEAWAEEALRFFRSLTLAKPVYVELNPRELRDAHRRLLAYLWVEGEEGWGLVNEQLLRAGLARLLVFYPEQERYYCRFLRAVALAQLEGLGLWESAATPRALWEIEADPVRYVTQAVTVVFAVSRVGAEAQGWALWAQGSRFGFRVLVQPALCPGFWALEGWNPSALVGKKLVVTGELSWDSLRNGPRILVHFPEQIRLWEGP